MSLTPSLTPSTDHLQTGQSRGSRFHYIWGDDEYPDLDLKRNLICYLYLIGWKGGFMFPSSDELANPPADGIYTTQMCESDAYTTLKLIFLKSLGRNEFLSWHSSRKIGYSNVVIRCKWANQHHNVSDIAQAAGHASYEQKGEANKTIKRYMCDAVGLANGLVRNSGNDLGPWVSNVCHGGDNAKTVAEKSMKYHKNIVDIVVGFMEKEVGVMPGDPNMKLASSLFDMVVAWCPPSNDPEARLYDATKFLAGDNQAEILACTQAVIAEKTRHQTKVILQNNVRQSRDLLHNASIAMHEQLKKAGVAESMISDMLYEAGLGVVYPDDGATELALAVSADGSNKRKAGGVVGSDGVSSKKQKASAKRKGVAVIEGRDKFEKMAPAERLDFMVKYATQNSGKYKDSDRTWAVRINPLVGCYESCHGSKKQQFLDFYTADNEGLKVKTAKDKMKSSCACQGKCKPANVD